MKPWEKASDPEPSRPGVRPHPGAPPEELDAWWDAMQPWREWSQRNSSRRARYEAKQRAEKAKRDPHPNWSNRDRLCDVWVPESEAKTSAAANLVARPARSVHYGAWQVRYAPCGARCVAFDVTDRRRVGNLYGACARHLLDALAADRSRTWMWADGRPLDRSSDLVGETALLSLAGVR